MKKTATSTISRKAEDNFPLIRRLLALGFSQAEIHSNLIDHGLSANEATESLAGYEEFQKVQPSSLESARNTGCATVIALFLSFLFIIIFVAYIFLGALPYSR